MRASAVALVVVFGSACAPDPLVAMGSSVAADAVVALGPDAAPSQGTTGGTDAGGEVAGRAPAAGGASDASSNPSDTGPASGDAQRAGYDDASDSAGDLTDATGGGATGGDATGGDAQMFDASSMDGAAIDVPTNEGLVADGVLDACTPVPESCNALDDDCDGATDEGVLCDDGDACTQGDVCVGGACQAGVQKCACGQDSDCTPKGWNPCLDQWMCQKGSGWSACIQVVGSAPVCPASEEFCAAQVCVASTGQCEAVPAHAGEPCNDGSSCTVGDTCAGGSCQGGAALACDDGNLCTADSCAAATGCSHQAVAGPCNDGNACTTEQCSNGSCLGAPVDCSDGDPCTLDSCQLGTCQHGVVPGCMPRAEVVWGSPFDDRLWSVRAAGDGGAWAAGESQGWGVGGGDGVVVRSTPCGTATWLRSYGGTAKEVFYDIQPAGEGALAAGVSHSGDPAGDAWVVRLAGDGAPVWHWAGGGSAYDFAKAVTASDDGGCALAGKTYSFGANTPEWHNALVVRLGGQGQLLWSRVFGAPVGSGSMDAAGIGVVRDSKGQADGFLVVGGSEGYGAGKDDVWLLRLELDGSTRWSVAYGAAGDDDAQSGFVQLADGGFLIGLWTDSQVFGAQNNDFALLRTDAQGKLWWLRRFGGAGKDEPYGIALDGNSVVLTGFSNSWSAGQVDALWLRVGLDGSLWSARRLGKGKDDLALGIARTSQGGFVLAGRTASAGLGGFDAWLVRTDHDGGAACDAATVQPTASDNLAKAATATWFTPATSAAGKTGAMKLTTTLLSSAALEVKACPCLAGP
jgi:hypothetical protein